MQKSQRMKCCTLLLLGLLIVSFVVMFSYWYLVPRQMHFWQLFAYNESVAVAEPPSAAELKFFMPPETVPKELKLKRGMPFIYQILH